MDLMNVDFSRMTIQEARDLYAQLENSEYYTTAREEEFVRIIKQKSSEAANFSKWCKAMNLENDGLPLLYKTTEESFRRTLTNWREGKNLPVFVRNLYKEEGEGYTNRNIYLDMLLYLGAHKEDGVASIEIFNKVIKRHGMERLYEMDYFDFCIAVSICLENKTGESAYKTYRSLLNDKVLKTTASFQITGEGIYTKVIENDFKQIERVGSLDEICKNGKLVTVRGTTDSAYKFVAKYAREFGRRHLSRYYALASLLYGESIDEVITSLVRENRISGFEIDDDGEQTTRNAVDTVSHLLDGEKYQRMLYLLGRNLTVGCHVFLEKGDRSRFTPGYIETICTELDEMYSQQTINIYNQSPAEFNAVMEKAKNLPRELLLLIALATIEKDVMRKYIDRYADEEDAKSTIREKIDKMLELCRVAKLDVRNSKYDFLLLLAIEKANYDIEEETEIQMDDDDFEYPIENFPYMDFLVNTFFEN